MCGSVTTKAQWIEQIASGEYKDYSIVGTFYNEQGQSCLIVTDNAPDYEWVRNIYSDDGQDKELYEQEYGNYEDNVKARARQAAADRGYILTKAPTKTARKARPARPRRNVIPTRDPD